MRDLMHAQQVHLARRALLGCVAFKDVKLRRRLTRLLKVDKTFLPAAHLEM